MDIFRNKNFSLLFFGRVLTNIGDSLYAVSAMWLIYDLGGSSFYTGLAGFLSILPRILQLLSGPIIDRIPIRGILVYSQFIQALLLLLVPIASFFDVLTVGLVLTITPILSICNTWVYPVQMSALPKILDARQLTKGNSLFSVAYQGIDVACNAISGILIVVIGAVSLYLWNALGFFIGAMLFAQLRINSANPSVKSEEDSEITINQVHEKNSRVKQLLADYKNDLVSGVKLLTQTPLAKLLYGIIVINAAGGATFSVLPAFGDKLGGPDLYGLLLMVQALGSVMGAACAPFLKLERMRLGLLYAMAFIASGIAWSMSVFSPLTWLVIIFYGLAWFPGGAVNVIINTVVQKGIPQQYLGLIFSATMALSGIAMPLGSLLGGMLGLWMGSYAVISLCGITVLLVGCYWLLDKTSRNLPKTEHVEEGFFSFRKETEPSSIRAVNELDG